MGCLGFDSVSSGLRRRLTGLFSMRITSSGSVCRREQTDSIYSA